MKQIEITVRLKESIENAEKKLILQGFEKIRESYIDDIYMTNLHEDICKGNIQKILRNSVLLRKLEVDGTTSMKLTYKNKEFDEKGDVISEQKVNVGCDNLIKAKELFEYLNFYELIEVKYHVIVYRKNDMEFAFQIVENLGDLIEYENSEDFENKSYKEIENSKKKMYEDIIDKGLNITEEIDVKKAYELIIKKYKL